MNLGSLKVQEAVFGTEMKIVEKYNLLSYIYIRGFTKFGIKVL